MGWIEISVAIIAVAFVFLVFYIVKTLKSVQSSLDHVRQSMHHMQGQIDEVSRETTELIRNTNQLTLDVHRKSKSLDSIFQSVQDAGQAVQQVTQSMKQVSTTLTDSVQRSVQLTTTEAQQDKLAEVIRYASWSINLWQKWQARKEKKKHNKEYESE